MTDIPVTGPEGPTDPGAGRTEPGPGTGSAPSGAAAPESSDDPPGGRTGRRRRWWIPAIPVAVVVAVVAGVLVWANHQAGHFFIYLPGSAPEVTADASCSGPADGSLVLPGGSPCVRLVIASGHAHAVHGKVLMVDVEEGKPTPLEYLEDRLGVLNSFHQGAQLLSNASVLGTTPAAQYNCQDTQYMATADQTAPIVALSRLGYQVTSTDEGVRVFQVDSDTPASQAGIECDDLITAVDGNPIGNAETLGHVLGAAKPGQRVAITVRRSVGTPGTSGAHTETLRFHPTLVPTPAAAKAEGDTSAAYLGVEIQDQIVYHYPFPVSIRVGAIGGPSAGLALTLGLLDTLSGGNLTGGHVIAATGTIASNGAVGAIGGVTQKTVAVERAGAKLFLVPDSGGNYTAAKEAAGQGLTVEGVNSLDQALEDIRRFGGDVPASLTPS